MIKQIFLVLLLIVNVGCGFDTGNGSSNNRPGRGARSNNPGNTPRSEGPVREVEIKPLRKDGAFNIAVAPGGGLNAYASLYLSHSFQTITGKQINELFDLYWGLSGGSLAATLFMNGKSDQVLNNFKAQVKKAFPDIPSITSAILSNPAKLASVATDADGERRTAFDKAIVASLTDLKFNKKAGNRFVLVASAANKTVCYADANIELPLNCIYKVEPGARVADGIINSSNFQLDRSKFSAEIPPAYQRFANLIPRFSPLFQKRKEKLLPTKEVLEVVDGWFADGLDGTSPLPLAVDYLLKFRTTNNAEHNIVVFDNGSATIPGYSNQAYRDSIGMDGDGYAKYQKDGVTVNVYLVKLTVSKTQFDNWTYDKEDSHWTSTEALVDAEVTGPRKGIFDRAVDAIKNSLL